MQNQVVSVSVIDPNSLFMGSEVYNSLFPTDLLHPDSPSLFKEDFDREENPDCEEREVSRRNGR